MMRVGSLFAGRGPGGKTAPPIADLIDAKGDCWEWLGRIERNGYGRTYYQNRRWGVHRLVWTLLVGEIPDGMQVDHLCCNRSCVNPDHLRVVTQRENNDSSGSITTRNRRKTHCPSGHPLDKTWKRPNGRFMRYCSTCRRQAYHDRKEVCP